MPNGQTHTFATLAATAATPLLVHGINAGISLPNTAAATIGCLLGVIITPDLDVDHGCVSMRTIKKRFGKYPSKLWRAIWMPYAIMIPHRSWLSHLPIAGTAFRLGYLYLIIFTMAVFIGALGVISMPRLQLSTTTLLSSNFIWAFSGLCLADTLHFLMDSCLSN